MPSWVEKYSKENELDEVYGYNEPTEPGKYTGWNQWMKYCMYEGPSISNDS